MRPRVQLTAARARAVVHRAGELWQLDPAVITGPGRTQDAAAARQACMAALRSATSGSLAQIGAAIGGRDHTTVMHGILAAEARAREEPETALRLLDLLHAAREARP